MKGITILSTITLEGRFNVVFFIPFAFFCVQKVRLTPSLHKVMVFVSSKALHLNTDF